MRPVLRTAGLIGDHVSSEVGEERGMLKLMGQMLRRAPSGTVTPRPVMEWDG